jgi:chitinase
MDTALKKKRIHKLLSGFLCLAVVISFCLFTGNTHTVSAEEIPSKNIVGYFTEWSIYASHNYYEVSNIPWDKVTHINYAFAKIENGKIAIFDPWAAIDKPFGDDKWDTPLKGNLGQLIKYKKLYPKVKTIISVGGWTQSMHFSDVALTDSSRTVFSESCVDFIRKYQFDGVDIDWEYPVAGGMAGNKKRPEDKTNFTLLLKKLRETLDMAGKQDGKKYLLTIAAPAGSSMIENTEPGEYCQYLDFINLMTYDYNGSWSNITNHLSPLYGNPQDPSAVSREKYNTDWTVSEYIRQGVPSNKLNIGVPYYSTGWKNVTGGTNGLFGHSNESPMGIWNDAGSPSGTNPYYYIKEVLEAPGSGFVKYRDSYSQVPYLWNPVEKIFYSYEDEISLKNKCEYVNKRNLGGVMFWEICGDYPSKGDTLTTVIYNSLSSAASQPTATPVPSEKPSPLYKISGYVKPDFSIPENPPPSVLSGFTVQIPQYGMSALTDSKGYYEISGIPGSTSPISIVVSKTNYLKREIRNIVLQDNIQIGTQASPVEIWAGDIEIDGTQNNAINISDIMEIAKAFNSSAGDGKYNPGYDFNKDNAINISDIITVAKHFNTTSSDYPQDMGTGTFSLVPGSVPK